MGTYHPHPEKFGIVFSVPTDANVMSRMTYPLVVYKAKGRKDLLQSRLKQHQHTAKHKAANNSYLLDFEPKMYFVKVAISTLCLLNYASSAVA
eukprot:10909064-Ditylum_brightwellii.AAC.1